MNILAVLGSPRTNGNTEAILNTFLKGSKDSNLSPQIKSVNVAKMNIKPCVACEKCAPKGSRCVIKDDMQGLFNEILKADTIIIASPVYWWNITAQMKTFIDRFYGLDYELFENKNMIFLSTHGGDIDDSGVKIAENSFRDMCKFIKMNFLYRYSVSSSKLSGPEKEAIFNEVYNLGKNLK